MFKEHDLYGDASCALPGKNCDNNLMSPPLRIVILSNRCSQSNQAWWCGRDTLLSVFTALASTKASKSTASAAPSWFQKAKKLSLGEEAGGQMLVYSQNNLETGFCSAGPDLCKYKQLELCKLHICSECTGTVHQFCFVNSVEDPAQDVRVCLLCHHATLHNNKD